jgi:gp16 family phage-associated protein
MTLNVNKYRATKAKLVRDGISLRKWALAKGYSVGSVYKAVRGHRHGPKSQKIREELSLHE